MKGVEQNFKDIKTVKELGIAKLVKFSFSSELLHPKGWSFR